MWSGGCAGEKPENRILQMKLKIKLLERIGQKRQSKSEYSLWEVFGTEEEEYKTRG